MSGVSQGVTRRPDYGLDAPGLAQGFLVAGAATTGLGMGLEVAAGRLMRGWPLARRGLVGWLLFVGAYLFGLGGLMRYASRVGKLRERDRLLDLVAWSGDEQVLDAGCGRGLMLVGAAKRLTTGQAIGVDVWSQVDQSENCPDAALENARLEGVSEKVTIETADVRSLPFSDGSFDVVLSHWVVHNLPSREDRATAVRELVRVLRPGGTLVLADIHFQADYLSILRDMDLHEVRGLEDGWYTRFCGLSTWGGLRPSAILARR